MNVLTAFTLRKNCVACFLLSAVLCIFLASCGIPKPPDEGQIAEDLPASMTNRFIDNPFDATNTDVCKLTVTSVDIEKRQTNEKEDIVYCTVELEDAHYRFTKHLKLNYNYYDQGGWCLDEYDEYKADEWEILDVPFDVEEASAALYNFSIAGPGTMTSDLANNIIQFSFPVEEAHTNGVYKGDGLVICQFDGIRWQCEINTEDIHFVWDILGTWAYRKIEETSYDKTINEIEVTIEDFDQTSGSMHGSWYMNSMFSFIRSHAETMKSLDNPDRVGIEIDTRGNFIKIWEDPNNPWIMHSYVEFFPDYVKADYATHFGPVYLERQYTSSSGNNSSVSDINHLELIEQANEDPEVFYGPGWFEGVMGSRFYVPDGFVQQDFDPAMGYYYSFWNTDLDMSISVQEMTLMMLGVDSAAMLDEYASRAASDGVTYAASGDNFYVVSGYYGSDKNAAIYYNRVDYDDTFRYEVDFQYPSSQAEEGEKILLEFLKNYSRS